MLQLDRIVKEYASGKAKTVALNGITLSFPDRGFVAILGPSGCGKSTLLNILGGLDVPTKGSLIVDGVDTKGFKDKDYDAYRNQKVGFVFQDYGLIDAMTVIENVRLSLEIRGVKRAESLLKAKSALAMVGLSDKAQSHPAVLSGGEKQRVAIARALAGDPKILLADEPTGALDSQNGNAVMTLLKAQSQQRLVVMVTHNEELAGAYADRIVALKDGKVASDSNPIQIERNAKETSSKPKAKIGLGFLNGAKTGFSHMVHALGRSLLTVFAASFGIIGLGFSLALTNGFQDYTERVNRQTGASMSLVVPSYTVETKTTEWSSLNQTQDYPSGDSVYPIYSPKNLYSYRYNDLGPSYFAFLDQLKKDGLLSDYVINYKADMNLDVLTTVPGRLATGEDAGRVKKVNVSATSNMAEGTGGLQAKPTNVFHPLFGDYSQDYDVLAGKLPTSPDEVVLLTDRRNALDFNTLKELGFYNPKDTQDDVLNLSLSSKVTPLSFSDILGKEYKVYSVDQYYRKVGEAVVDTDDIGPDGNPMTRTFSLFATKMSQDSDFYQTQTPLVDAKVVGILRPKKSTSYPVMRSGVAYLPSLAEKIRKADQNNPIGESFANAFVRKAHTDGVDRYSLTSLSNEITQLVNDKGDGLTNSDLYALVNKYFLGYVPVNDNYKEGTTSLYHYTDASYFFSEAAKFGANLVPEELKELSLNDADALKSYVEETVKLVSSPDEFNARMTGLAAVVYSYSDIDSITLVPSSLSSASALSSALTDYNTVQAGSVYHASDEKGKVFYQDYVSYYTKDIGQAVSLANVILTALGIICLLAAVAICFSVTNMSVLEREREIGVMRALGSRKIDVMAVFESEAMIEGAISGFLGTLLSYVLTFPMNALISAYYPWYNTGNLASMAWWHPLALVPLAVAVTGLAALIPSYRASLKKPAVCLKGKE